MAARSDSHRIGRLARLVDSHAFTTAILAVIIANAVVLGLQTYDDLVERYGDALDLLNDLFLAIFVAVILALPALTGGSVWSQVSALDALNKPVVLPAVQAGEPNPLRLDPELTYAVCRIDLRQAPGMVSGPLPPALWALAV